MRFSVVLAMLAGCRGDPKPVDVFATGTAHAHGPVDPALALAIVVPDVTEVVTIAAVRVTAVARDLSTTEWQTRLIKERPSDTVGTPQPFNDGFVATLERNDEPDPLHVWYRPALGIECRVEGIATTRGNDQLASATCFSAQRVADGLYVPFAMADDVLIGVVEPDHPRVRADLGALGPPLAPATTIARGDLADGSWVLTVSDRAGYFGRVDRTIGGLATTCITGNVPLRTEVDRAMTLCRAIEAVAPKSAER